MQKYLIENDGTRLEATSSCLYKLTDTLFVDVLFYDEIDKFRVQLHTSTNERSICESGRWPFQIVLANGQIIGCDPDAFVDEHQQAYVPFLRTYGEKV